jgi:kynurenine formamidase
MCEAPETRPAGWTGWIDVPAARAPRASGAWIDLSHVLNRAMPNWDEDLEPHFPRTRSLPADPLNLTEIHMSCHAGTHVDAPIHFLADGPAFHEIPLDRLYGSGVVWQIERRACETIEAADFESQEPALEPGDMVLLDTGWADRPNEENYPNHPYLSDDAARWLVDRRVKLLGVDFGSPDAPRNAAVRKDEAVFDFPVHHILLSRGVLIAENLRNVRALAGQRVELMFLALNIEGSDGAPARVAARPAP